MQRPECGGVRYTSTLHRVAPRPPAGAVGKGQRGGEVRAPDGQIEAQAARNGGRKAGRRSRGAGKKGASPHPRPLSPGTMYSWSRARGVHGPHPCPSPRRRGEGKRLDPRVCDTTTATATPRGTKKFGQGKLSLRGLSRYYDVEGLLPIKKFPRDRDPPLPTRWRMKMRLSAESGDDCGAAVPAAQKVGAQDGRRRARSTNMAQAGRPHHKHGE